MAEENIRNNAEDISELLQIRRDKLAELCELGKKFPTQRRKLRIITMHLRAKRLVWQDALCPKEEWAR